MMEMRLSRSARSPRKCSSTRCGPGLGPECIYEVADEGWVAGDRGGRVVRWLRIGLLDAGAGGHGDDGAKPAEDCQEVATHSIGRVGPARDYRAGPAVLWSGDPPEESIAAEQGVARTGIGDQAGAACDPLLGQQPRSGSDTPIDEQFAEPG